MTEKGGQQQEEDYQEDHGETGETTEDAAGVGISDSKSKQDSHEGNTSQLTFNQDSDAGKLPKSKRHKPGDVNENRTVGNNTENIKQGLVSKETSENVKNDEVITFLNSYNSKIAWASVVTYSCWYKYYKIISIYQ